jgi:LysM repeat protein
MYRVQYGDTLYNIAARLRVNVWTLAQTNGIYNINWIYAGQWLRVPGCAPNPVPQRRNVSGTWVSGNYSLELSEAVGCPGPVCAVTGRLIEARGTTTPDIRDVQGTINVNTGAISVIIAMPGAQGGFTGTVDAYSRTMSGQLSGVGWLTFTKR